MARYEVQLLYTVIMDVRDEEIIDRCTTDEWQDTFYECSRDEAIVRLAQLLGVHREPLRNLDGWADCDGSEVGDITAWCSTESVREVSPDE